MTKKILFVAFAIIWLFYGCSKDSTTDVYTPTCTGVAKSYQNDVAPVIQTYCNGCHQNFSTYSSLFAVRASVRSSIVSGQMPASGSLTTAPKEKSYAGLITAPLTIKPHYEPHISRIPDWCSFSFLAIIKKLIPYHHFPCAGQLTRFISQPEEITAWL